MLKATAQITVWLTERVAGELDALQRASGLSKIDLVNRAISLYRFVERERESGRELAIYDPDAETFQRVHIS